MAVTFVRNHTAVTPIKAAGTTIDLNISTAVPAGNLIVARILFDNASTASKPIVSSIQRATNETNTWVFLGAARSTSTSAGAFASGEIWCINTTITWPVRGFTVTLDTSTVMKATIAQEFSGVNAVQVNTAGTNYSTTTTAASAATTGTTPAIGDLAIGFIFGSNVAAVQAGDNDTTGGSWSAMVGVGSTGSGAATNNFGGGQYKILTGANHQTLNNSAAMTAGNGAIVAVLQQYVSPTITQAAYRFYAAENYEFAPSPLANQDTAYTADVTNGFNLQVRLRLQSTNATTILDSDDFELQWEKNASGTWTSVIGEYSDSYDSSNVDAFGTLYTVGAVQGQSFLGNGGKLSRVAFWLNSNGFPGGNVFARLYAHTGTFGGGGTGTGAVLAQSSALQIGTKLAPYPGWRYFTFDETFTLQNGVPYVVGIAVDTAGDVDTNVGIGSDISSPTHQGSMVQYVSSSWSAVTTTDRAFQVLTPGTVVTYYNDSKLTDDGDLTTSRLTGGTGTYVTGLVSLDGLAENLGYYGWAGNNYTEVLYAVTLKSAGLANGDTLRFRVRRNGATTGITYTQTPTINVTKTAPAITQAAYRFYADGVETGEKVLASYEVGSSSLGWFANYIASAQSFLGDGKPITRASFKLGKTGTVTGTLRAHIYAHSGTFGTDGKPTGSPLASSTNTLSAASLSDTPAWFQFTFDGSFTSVNGTPYFVAIQTDTLGDGSNYVSLGNNSSAPLPAGNTASLNGSLVWSSSTGSAKYFYVYSDTGLAAQDTSCTVDTSATDVNLQLRTRLQSTNSVSIASTTDFQLQYEKNASGTWVNVAPALTLADSLTTGGADQGWDMLVEKEMFQAFTGNGEALAQIDLYMHRFNTSTAANLTVEIRAHTGTFGTTGAPTGSALKTSSVVLTSSVPTSVGWVTFPFDSTYTLVNGTKYCLVLKYSGSGDGVGPYVSAGNLHPGTAGNWGGSGPWTVWATDDIPFRVYTAASGGAVVPFASTNLTDAAATTNRLTGGSGSFTAGEISETGLVTDLGWSGNDYTELLYAITVMKAEVTPSDTLRFRVLWNGATTGLTFSQVPTITIGTGVITINATGIATGEAFGTATIVAAQTVTVTSIASAEALGTATITGLYTLTATGIATGEALGTATITTLYTLTATGIATGEALGTATLTKTYTLTATGIVSGEALGTATLTKTYTLTTTGIATGEAFGTATLTTIYTLTTTGIVSGEALGTATVYWAQSVTATGIASAEALGTATVTVGALIITATGIPTGEVLRSTEPYTRWFGQGVPEGITVTNTTVGPGDTAFTTVTNSSVIDRSDILFTYTGANSTVQWNTPTTNWRMFRFDLVMPASGMATSFQIVRLLDSAAVNIAHLSLAGAGVGIGKVRILNPDTTTHLESGWQLVQGARYVVQILFGASGATNTFRVNFYDYATGALYNSLSTTTLPLGTGSQQVGRIYLGAWFYATAGQTVTMGDFAYQETDGTNLNDEIQWITTVSAKYNLTTTGIATAEAFGTPTINVAQTVSATGIASGEVFGTNIVRYFPLAETFTDTFDTEVSATKWPNVENGGAVWEAGRAKLVAPTPGAYTSSMTDYVYDFRESYCFCRITPHTNAIQEMETVLTIASAANDGGSMIISKTPVKTITVRKRQSAVVTDTELSYDPATQKWFQMKLTGTTLYYQTSPDAVTWTTIHTETITADLSAVRIRMRCGNYGATAGTGTAYFDNFNVVVSENLAELWNGTSWRTDSEIWNGTSWHTDAEVWNGTSWMPV